MRKMVIYYFAFEVNSGTEEAPDIETRKMKKALVCDESELAKTEEVARAEAFDGEYSVVDVPDQPPTELEKLSSKLDAAIQSNAMLENCLVEMASIVYA